MTGNATFEILAIIFGALGVLIGCAIAFGILAGVAWRAALWVVG